MTKAQAIKKHCLDCSGHQAKEVTLCHLIYCPLWEFRFGNCLKNKNFNKRMQGAKKAYPKDFKEMIISMSDMPLDNVSLEVKAFVSIFLEKNKD